MGGREDENDATVAARRRTPATAVERGATPERPPGDADPAESLAPGTTAGRYVLLARLGAGGAGLVYSAFDPELDRKVAIKLLRSADDESADDSHGRARLLREAQAMARLKHPNVLPVYDVGTFEHPTGPRIFLAMELVEGGTLRSWLKQRRSRREILEVLTACGRGLNAAHAAGLVHRDFKPDNVLIDADGRVFVTDFGLVRAAGPHERVPSSASRPPTAIVTPLTGADTVLGTPGYMAPEQYRAEAIDERTDQFSFCVTLWEALCGRPLFPRTSFNDVMDATLADELPRRVLDGLHQARVPSWLSRVIARGLSREREARYPSMTELIAALSNDPIRRTRRIMLVAGALLSIGGAVVGARRLTAHKEQVCRGAERQLDGVWDAAVKERVRQTFTRLGMSQRLFDTAATALDGYARDLVAQHRDACEATRIRGEQPESVLVLRMSCLDGRRKELAALSALLADADRATAFGAAEAASKLTSIRSCGDVAALTARIPPPADAAARLKVEKLRDRLVESKVLIDAARYAPARAVVDEVRKAEATLSYGPLHAATLQQLARLERDPDGQMKASEASLVESVEAAYASHDDAQVASSLTDLAMLDAYWLGEHESGERWVRLAKAAIARLGGSDELEAERARVEAEIWIGEDKGALAVAAAEPALRLAEKVYGPVSVRTASFHSTLGAAHSANGNEQLAREHYGRQYDILAQLLGPDHPLVAMALNNLGLNADAEGRLDDAERFLRQSANLLDEALGHDHPRVAIALSNLGMTLRSHHKPKEALAAFQRAIAINDRQFGPGYSDSLDALLGTGESLIALGREREAIAPIERALALVEHSSEPNGWGRAEGEFALAQALWGSGGDRARALALARHARIGLAAEANATAQRQLVELDAWLAHHHD